MSLNSCRVRTILGYNDTKVMWLGILIVSFLMNLLLFGNFLKEGAVALFSGCQIIAFVYTSIFWLVFRQLYIEIVKRYDGYENIRTRYMITIPLGILVFLIVKLFLGFFLDPFFTHMFGEKVKPDGFIATLGSMIFVLLVISIYEVAHLFANLKESQIEKEQLIKANISSQLEGLKNQVNPHFLFNSLNTLASIIPEDQEKSISFIGKLSKVYRYILDINDKKLVSLEDELKFLHSYTFLLKERFGDNIHIDINLGQGHLHKYIVPLSLQITFENAIKHNIISKKQPLKVKVFLDNNAKYLVVENNLQKKNTLNVSTGKGLQNIKRRYEFFTKEEVKVIETSAAFAVYLPLLSSMNILAKSNIKTNHEA